MDKKRSIGVAAKEIGVKEYVIRFWETQFPESITPTIGAGGRRYYYDEDIKLLLKIKDYLYKDCYSIKGLQKLLKSQNFKLGKNRQNDEIFNSSENDFIDSNSNRNSSVDKIDSFRKESQYVLGVDTKSDFRYNQNMEFDKNLKRKLLDFQNKLLDFSIKLGSING